MVIREERVRCSCGEALVVEYEEREAPGGGAAADVEYSCPTCLRSGKARLHAAAAKFVVRRATDTPVFPRSKLPEK